MENHLKQVKFIWVLSRCFFLLAATSFMAGCWQSEALLTNEAEFIDPSGNKFQKKLEVKTDSKTRKSMVLEPVGKWFRHKDENGKVMNLGFLPGDYAMRGSDYSYLTLISKENDASKPYTYTIAKLSSDLQTVQHCLSTNSSFVATRAKLREVMRKAVLDDQSNAGLKLDCTSHSITVLEDGTKSKASSEFNFRTAYKFDHAPAKIKEEAKNKRYLPIKLGSTFTYSELIGVASHRSGVRLKKAKDDKDAKYIHDYKNATSTIVIGFGAEYKQDGSGLTEETEIARDQLKEQIKSYLRRTPTSPGAAEQYGAFISSINAVIPPSQIHFKKAKSRTAEENEAMRIGISRAYSVETRDWKKALEQTTLPVGRYIVQFNDVSTGNSPRILTLEEVTPFLEEHFSTKRHIWNVDQYLIDARQRLAEIDKTIAADKKRLAEIHSNLVLIVEAQILLDCGNVGLPLERLSALAERVYEDGRTGKKYELQNGKFNCSSITRLAKQF